MKVTNKFYLLQVGQDIVSPLGFRYEAYILQTFLNLKFGVVLIVLKNCTNRQYVMVFNIQNT